MTPQAGGSGRPGQLSPAIIDDVFRALSDPTRRDVLGRLSAHAVSVSALADGAALLHGAPRLDQLDSYLMKMKQESKK